MRREYTIRLGTDENNVISGTPNPDFINGRGGHDLILGHGGDDILIGGSGADRFAVSVLPPFHTPAHDDAVEITKHGRDHLLHQNDGGEMRASSSDPGSEPLQETGYHNDVDSILDFSRAEKDHIDFSSISAELENDLAFSSLTPAPYAVYYAMGVDPQYDVVTGTDLNILTDGHPITVMADLDGDPRHPEIMVVIWGWVGDSPLTHLAASDLIL